MNLNTFLCFNLCCVLRSASLLQGTVFVKAKPVQPTEVNCSDVECQEDDVECSSIFAPLFCKSKVAVLFRLRCLDLFFIIIANIYSGSGNNEVFFLSSNQLSKRLILEHLGFPEEGLKGEHGTSLCRCISFALYVCSPEASLFSPVPPYSVLQAGMTCPR